MNNIRLYHPDSIVENSTSLLTKQQTHYIANVMRLKRGSNINFFNKEGEWLSEIVFLEKDRVEVKFLNKIKNSKSFSNIELAVCLVKKTPMEIILQKSAELGICKIIPIISDRTEVKKLNYDRANKIIIEATEQSNQMSPPKIDEITKLENFFANISQETKILFADVNSRYKLKVSDLKDRKKISILIGPEGDFSPQELELILGSPNLTSFSLSRNILRTDTAVISAISLVNFINNDH